MSGPNSTSFQETSELLMSVRVPPEVQLMPIFEHNNEEWVGLTAPMLANKSLTACEAYLQSLEGFPPTLSLREFAYELLPDTVDAAASPMLPYFPVPLGIYLKDTRNVSLVIEIRKKLIDMGREVDPSGHPEIR